jgi:hypothetical protein
MASVSTIELASRLLCQLGAPQSQGSLTSQAHDCAPLVQALGYYDLADFLAQFSDPGDVKARALHV